jgi:hypothetical protein
VTGQPARMLRGENVYRVYWLPGSDRLRGICHCGAETDADDPVAVWEWLLGHPAGHSPAPAPGSGPMPVLAAVSGG